MYPDGLIDINGVKYLTPYGICIGVGILAAFLVIWGLAKKGKVESKFVELTSYSLIASTAVGFVFAAIFQWLYNAVQAQNEGRPVPPFTFEGMTFLGGLIGGASVFLLIYFIVVYVIGKKTKNPTFKFQGRLIDVISILPVGLTLAHAFGRIGCFFAGCCYGIPTDSFLGVQFPHLPSPVHPTQLYESAFLFILSFIMFLLYFKKRFQQNMGVYLISYGVFRFLIEYIRGDERGSFIGSVSPSQFWSIVMVILGIVLIVLMVPIAKKRKSYLEENPIVGPVKASKKSTKTTATEKTLVNEASASEGDTTSVKAPTDSVEDGFQLDEKIVANVILEKHLPEDFTIPEDITEKPEVAPSVGNVIETPKTTEEDLPTYDEESKPELKIGEGVASEGFSVDTKDEFVPVTSEEVTANASPSTSAKKDSGDKKENTPPAKEGDEDKKEEPSIAVLKEATEDRPTVYVAKSKRGSRAPAVTVKKDQPASSAKKRANSKKEEVAPSKATAEKEIPKTTVKKEDVPPVKNVEDTKTEETSVAVLKEATEDRPTVYVAKAKKGSRAPAATVKPKTATKKTSTAAKKPTTTSATAKTTAPKATNAKATTPKADGKVAATKSDAPKKTSTAAKPKAPANKKTNPHVPTK